MQYHSPEGRKEPGETYPDEVHFFDQDMKEMELYSDKLVKELDENIFTF